jgi:hypothetical protein
MGPERVLVFMIVTVCLSWLRPRRFHVPRSASHGAIIEPIIELVSLEPQSQTNLGTGR